MFPFSVQIRKKINSEDKTSIQDQIKEIVLQSGGNIQEMTETSVTFSTKFIKLNWHPFFLIDKGVFIIKEGRLVFRFYMYRLFIMSTVISLLFFNATKNDNPYLGLFAFLFLCVGNWIYAIIKGYGVLNKITFD